jgi:hypothetical protein
VSTAFTACGIGSGEVSRHCITLWATTGILLRFGASARSALSMLTDWLLTSLTVSSLASNIVVSRHNRIYTMPKGSVRKTKKFCAKNFGIRNGSCEKKISALRKIAIYYLGFWPTSSRGMGV